MKNLKHRPLEELAQIPVGQTMLGSSAYAWTLRQLDAQKVFFYIGGPIIGIAKAIENEVGGIEIVIGPDEIDLGHAAEGYFRVTGKPINVLNTSGVVVKQASPLLAATMDSQSIIVTVGQVSYEGLAIGDELFQGARLVEPLREYVKWAYRIPNADMIQPALKTAYHLATTGRPGAILLELAGVISNEQKTVLKDIDEVPLIRYRQKKPKVYHLVNVQKAELGELKERMEQSQRPVLMLGAGVHHAGAVEQALDYGQKTDTPMVATLNVLGAIDSNAAGNGTALGNLIDRLYLGMTGMHGSIWAQLAVHSADLVVGIGNRFDNRITLNANEFAPDADIYWINPHNPGISKIIAGRVKKIDMDARAALDALVAGSSNLKHDRWLEQINQWKLKYEMPVHVPRGVIQHTREFTMMHECKEPYVPTGVGQHQMWVAQFWRFDPESGKNMFLSSGGLAPMGIAAPLAAGALMAEPDRPVYVFNGDGSALMDIRSLLFGYQMRDELAQHGNGMKQIIFRDNSLGMVRNWQSNMYGKSFNATDLSNLIPRDYFKDQARAAHFAYFSADYIDGNPFVNRAIIENFVKYRGNAILEVRMRPVEALPMTPGTKSVRDAYLPNGNKVDPADLLVGRNWNSAR
jgi:acetolactate synthase I/II/III large subunit